jgi:hypothetical protein
MSNESSQGLKLSQTSDAEKLARIREKLLRIEAQISECHSILRGEHRGE